MAKTISLKEEAYNRLRAAKRSPNESFSQVVLRAVWPDETISARGLLDHLKHKGPFFSEAELEEIAAAKDVDQPPVDKWQNPSS